MKTDENGVILCPECNCPTEYLYFFNETYEGKNYIVHWNIKCPKCHEYTIIKETYTLTNVEKEW